LLHIGKHRKKEQRFIVEGPKLIEEFLASNYEIIQLFATEDWVKEHRNSHPHTETITAKELQSISLLSTPNQVLGIVSFPKSSTLVFENGDLILGLDTIQDPGNLGTIIRIADWFGIKKIICSHDTADAYNPKVVQATMGALTRVKIDYVNLKEWITALPSQVHIYGTLLDGENIYTTQLDKEGIIIIGNESQGISAEIQALVNTRIKIPAYGNSRMESLNAAIATAIVCAEFRR
jgi:TrmH family RNA methyltransferase